MSIKSKFKTIYAQVNDTIEKKRMTRGNFSGNGDYTPLPFITMQFIAAGYPNPITNILQKPLLQLQLLRHSECLYLLV